MRGYGFKENEASEEMVEYLEKLKKNTEDDGGDEPKDMCGWNVQRER